MALRWSSGSEDDGRVLHLSHVTFLQTLHGDPSNNREVNYQYLEHKQNVKNDEIGLDKWLNLERKSGK